MLIVPDIFLPGQHSTDRKEKDTGNDSGYKRELVAVKKRNEKETEQTYKGNGEDNPPGINANLKTPLHNNTGHSCQQ